MERLRAAANHYEVLDVEWKAGLNEIKESYYALARRYHPDRFHLKSGTRLHEQISSAFARITQAYETLVDANARAAYDATVERSRKFAESAPKSSQPAKPVTDELLEFDPTESGTLDKLNDISAKDLRRCSKVRSMPRSTISPPLPA